MTYKYNNAQKKKEQDKLITITILVLCRKYTIFKKQQKKESEKLL
jgi:hypothetical protein